MLPLIIIVQIQLISIIILLPVRLIMIVIRTQFIIRVDTEAGVWIVDLLVIAIGHELVVDALVSALLYVWRRFDRVLGLPLTGLLLVLGDELESQAPPVPEEACHVLHPVISVEEGRHGIEQVLVAVQILLFLDELKLEAGPNRLVLQAVIVLNVVNQLLEQITAVVDLEQCRILLLI